MENQTEGTAQRQERGRPDPNNMIRKYEEAKTLRSQYNTDYRVAAAHCLPNQYQRWMTDGPAFFSGNKASASRRVAYDTTGMRALPKWVAIAESMLTPRSQTYHGVEATNNDLMRILRVRQYFEALTKTLFRERYRRLAGYNKASTGGYNSLGAYGNGPIFISQRRATKLHKQSGISYRACAMSDCFWLIDDQGNISHFFRRIWLNARQAEEKFGRENVPKSVEHELKKKDPSETEFFEFVHIVWVKPDDDVDLEAFDTRRFPLAADYMGVKDREYIGEQSGYTSWPYVTPRMTTDSDEPYGFSPAQRAIAAMGSASATKKSYLKVGQRAAEQVILAHSEMQVNGVIDLNPNAVNFGAVNKEGRALVQSLPPGDFSLAADVLTDERNDVNESFLVHLFNILTESPQMSATEIVERSSEKATLLAPMMGFLQDDLLGPQVEREVDILAHMGKLPEMPPELIEAVGEYEIVYTSPLALSLNAQETAGFLRAFQIAVETASALQDPSPLDHFDTDAAVPAIAFNQAVPSSWMASPDQIAAKREQRASQQAVQAAVQAAPAIAGVIQAQQGTGGE